MSNMSSGLALSVFRNACGLSVPLALVCQDVSSSAGAYTPLDYPRPFMLIGRLPTADLCLNREDVSRRHTFLQAIEGRVYCIDLESRTKTFWQGKDDAQSQGWLDPGGSIQVGSYQIHRTDLQPDLSPHSGMANPFSALADDQSGHRHLPRLTLELPFRVDGKPATWAPEGLLALVGRSDQCQLVLADNNISQYHACLVRTPLGLWLVDLASREGVYINDMRIRWAWLADGDRVRMGQFTIVLRYETPPEGISREEVPLSAGAAPIAPPASSPGVARESFDSDRKALEFHSKSRSMDLVRVVPSDHPPHRAVPATLEGLEWEPVLAGGSNPGAMWQQQIQMMQSFHNDMVMMFQMFVAMHREHLGSVRDELDRVQELTRELTRLNAELGQIPESAKTNPPLYAGGRSEKSRTVPDGGKPRPEGSPQSPASTRKADRTKESREC